MRIYQRTPGGNYWFAFHHRGKPVRRSAGTADKEAATEYAAQYRAELWRSDRLGERPRVAWEVAVLDWLAANQHLRSLSDRKDHLRWAGKHLTGAPVASISRNELDRLANLKATDGASNATVNRYLASISAVLGHAVTKGWIDSQPRVPKRVEAEHQPRWATQKQAAKLVAALPEHLAPIAAFSLATGLRWANVAGLRRDRVDNERRTACIPAAQAKGKRALTSPLNDAALEILKTQKGKHRTAVFHYHGKPIATYGKPAWRIACKKAGLPAAFTWHDLRHTWASWHVQAGTPLAVLQELGGWRSLAMVMVYAHLAPSHVAAYAGNVGSVQNQVHGENGGKRGKAA
jgi:integrase